jgi:hypothetical protein
MIRFGTLLILAVPLLSQLIGCASAEDKARIRLAVSAYKAAADASRPDETLMADLQRAIDVVPDGHARSELVDCQLELQKYKLSLKRIELAYEQNLVAIGHGRDTTAKEADAAMSKAQRDNPRPDPDEIAKCEVSRLPDLAR